MTYTQVGPIKDTKIGTVEKPHAYYDEVYTEGVDLVHMQPIYESIVALLKGFRSIKPQVLEIGCGTGILGKMIMDAGFRYRGFDFSAVAIRKCPHEIRAFVTRRNAYHTAPYRVGHNVVVAVEVMEHLRDLEVVERISSGSYCIFTLPNFTDEAHLRVYPDSKEIKRYYKGLIKWSRITPVKMCEDDGVDGGYKIIHVCKGVKI